MGDKKKRTMAEIAADIMDLGPFLPGSVRTDRRRHVGRDGRVKVYDVQPRLNLRAGGRRVDKRVPKGEYERVKELTENYRRFQALVAEFEEAAVREYLPGQKRGR